jgi:inner membrane protein
VDVVTYLWDPAADLAFRRGWTHGVLALALWPLLLTGALMLVDRALHRLRNAPPRRGPVPGQLLLLSSVAVVSHPLLDTLNTYGMRWLMPFSGRWFYGDTLFIVDPWLWVTLGLGVMLSRPRQGGPWPPRIGLVISLVYTTAMAGSTLAARNIAGAAMARISGEPVGRLMVSPRPVNPFRRSVVAEQDERYLAGGFEWLTARHVDPGSVRIFPKGPSDHPAVRAAAATTLGRRFLVWARFPVFRLEPAESGDYVVHILDLRYTDRPGVPFGAVSIPVAGTLSPSPGRGRSASPHSEVTEYRNSTSSTNSAVTRPSPKR